MHVSPSIFKAYDIRGVVPATLTEAVAEGLGQAFGCAALAQGQTTVAVGRDGRLSGPALSAALMRGLVATGAVESHTNIIDDDFRAFLRRQFCDRCADAATRAGDYDYLAFEHFCVCHDVLCECSVTICL